ncbi:plasmid partitioning protein RepB [Ochrobactrum sp. SFR4]|uniref:plasmid partitioning protein RepB n=1 Tax=Ochrobactrum sp. SFR4 TaxID=2717368 RepID=UPI001C8C7D51|nr:plasmid partitioning protein RepB [Ochrobactrum sp. SFR4]MBX8827333.1 plasmid partitioning protein RepB [Ochrobactrum sp. SFR4]
MSRKNPFANLDIEQINKTAEDAKTGYGMTGAAKTVVRSIEEMAENTKKLMSGEAIVEIDPSLLDSSFISDRLTGSDEEYEELKNTIRNNGQDSPILVRPHPTVRGRYMIVFGHRRTLVARELGIKVKAVVKQLDDVSSAVAQGQENSSRSNLSFIERAYFAKNLLDSGMTKEVIKAAISVDDPMLSKMLSVVEIVPYELMIALASCKKIGRDKWLNLRQLILNPTYLNAAIAYAKTESLLTLPDDQRFDDLHNYLKRYNSKSKAKAPKKEEQNKTWTTPDNAVEVLSAKKGRSYSINLTKAEATPFGEWLTDKLDALYDEYKSAAASKKGD